MMQPFRQETERARAAQTQWVERTIAERLRCVRAVRYEIVRSIDHLTAAVVADVGRSAKEVIATDLLPTAAACKWLERSARGLLSPRQAGGRPVWLFGCRDQIHRQPRGVVGMIGTWNYPIFLLAVPMLHALVAGNAIVLKPSELAPQTAAAWHALLVRAGFPADLVQLVPATREAGLQLAEAELDFFHFTGSEGIGRKLAARLGERLIPSVLELSGCDAAFVLADANVAMACDAIAYGVSLNAGQTCMAVRRVYVPRAKFGEVRERLAKWVQSAAPMPVRLAAQAVQAHRLIADARQRGAQLEQAPPQASGEPNSPTQAMIAPAVVFDPPAESAICQEASFAPIVAVVGYDSIDAAMAHNAACPYRLTASIFSENTDSAYRLAARLKVGAVVVNDVIVPTAHPGTPFTGHGASGWGSTQGAEGLLEFTTPCVVSARSGSFRPHYDRNANPNVPLGMLRLTHAQTFRERWSGFWQLLRGLRG